MNKNTIITYSFLVFIYESQKKDFNDLSDVFIPLIKRVLSKMYSEGHVKGESISEIKEKFDSLYGLNIPYPIIRKILEKIENSEKRNSNNQFKIFDRDGFIIDHFTFIDFEDEIDKEEREIESLNDAYKKYLEVEGILIENQTSLFEFIDKNKIYLSTYFEEKEGIKNQFDENEPDLFVQAKFIDFINGTSLYDTFKKIYLGSIISNYLEIDYESFKSDVELVFDTNFIVGVINLSSKESNHTCKTLLDIAKKLNYVVTILPETISETQNLLRNHAKNFNVSEFLTLVDEQSIYLSCHRQGLKSVDLERRANNLKEDLADLGIHEAVHNLSKRAKHSPEYDVFKTIRSAEESAINDTIAVLYVKEKRKKIDLKSFSDVNCWFVSDTKSRLHYSGSGTYREIVRAEDLLNILWLSNPKISNTNEVINSSLTRLVSTTLGNVLPRKSSLLTLNHNIHKYLKKEKIRIKDVVLLANNMAEKTNKNLEDYSQLYKDKDETVINSIIKIANSQEKIENNRKAKISEYLVSVKNSSDLAVAEVQKKYENKLNHIESQNLAIIEGNKIQIADVNQQLLIEKESNLANIEQIGNKIAKKWANRIYWGVYIIVLSIAGFVFWFNNFQFEKSAKILSAVIVVFVILAYPIWSLFKKDELKWHKFYDWIYSSILSSHYKTYNYDESEHKKIKENLESYK